MDIGGKHRFFQQVSANPGGLEAPAYVLSSPDGHRAAYLIGPGVTFADIERGTTTGEIPFQQGFRFSAGTWSADGRRYATAGVAGWIRVWDVDGGRLLMRHRAPAPDVTESPPQSTWVAPGRLLAVGAGDDVRTRPPGAARQAGPTSGSPRSTSRQVLTTERRSSWSVDRDGDTFWSDFSKRWALVDLESGTVLRKGRVSTWASAGPRSTRLTATTRPSSGRRTLSS